MLQRLPSYAGRISSLTRGLEHPGVALAVPLRKGLHHPVDLLGLSREPEAPQELPEGEGRAGAGWRQLTSPGSQYPGTGRDLAFSPVTATLPRLATQTTGTSSKVQDLGKVKIFLFHSTALLLKQCRTETQTVLILNKLQFPENQAARQEKRKPQLSELLPLRQREATADRNLSNGQHKTALSTNDEAARGGRLSLVKKK